MQGASSEERRFAHRRHACRARPRRTEIYFRFHELRLSPAEPASRPVRLYARRYNRDEGGNRCDPTMIETERVDRTRTQ
jgi:hypothetical protein